jgi:hypothetical protein
MAIESVEAPESSQESAKWLRWRLAVIAVSVAVYAVSWTGGLVWDDHYFVDGSAIGGGKSLWNCFTVPFLNHYFRPVVSFDFFFERRLWQANALGYRLVSTALHAAATGLMLGLLKDAFGSRRAAVVGALVFAIHPVQVGAVAWIGGRTDALCELWLLLFARCLVIAALSVQRRGPMLAWAVIWYTMALFTKEQSLALLPLVPLAFACWKPRDGVNLRHTSWILTIPFAAVCVLFLVLGWYLGMPRPQPLPGTLIDQLGQAGHILAYYALILTLPTPSLMHLVSLGPFEHVGEPSSLFGYLALAAAVWLLARLFKRNRPAAWFLALTLLSILPVSGFLPLPFLLVAPYRAAIGCIGISALGGQLFASGLPRVNAPNRWRPAAVVGGIFLVFYISLTVWGASQWRDEVTLFRRIARSDPEAIVPPYVLSFMLAARNDNGGAARQMEAALRNVFGSSAWNRQETAIRAIREDPAVLRRARQNQGSTGDPRLWVATMYNDLAQLYLRVGENAAALAAYQAGEVIDPKNADIASGIGYVYAAAGNYAEALRRMKQAIALNPYHLYSLEWVARYYTNKGQWESAVQALTAWSNADPGNAEAKRLLEDAKAQAERLRALKSGTLFLPR